MPVWPAGRREGNSTKLVPLLKRPCRYYYYISRSLACLLIAWSKKMKQTFMLIESEVPNPTFSHIKGSSRFASACLPGQRVRQRTDKILFTASKDHFTHFMEFPSIVNPTVKLCISVREFYQKREEEHPLPTKAIALRSILLKRCSPVYYA